MSDCFNGSSAGHAPERRHRSAGGCFLRCGRVVTSGYNLPADSYALLVQEVGAASPLFAVNADKPLNPASSK